MKECAKAGAYRADILPFVSMSKANRAIGDRLRIASKCSNIAMFYCVSRNESRIAPADGMPQKSTFGMERKGRI
jgi:hypothetical protein